MDKGAGVLYIEVSNIKLKRYEKSLDKNLSIEYCKFFVLIYSLNTKIELYIEDYNIIYKDSTTVMILMTMSECPL